MGLAAVVMFRTSKIEYLWTTYKRRICFGLVAAVITAKIGGNIFVAFAVVSFVKT